MEALLLVALSLSLAAPPTAPPAYFPRGTFGEGWTRWFDDALARMQEPILSGPQGSERSFRFTVLPTWGHPTSVRLTLHGESGTIEVRQLSGHGGFEMGRLAESSTVPLDKAQVGEFLDLFSALHFSNLPAEEKDRGGRDGSEWILEATDAGIGTYHAIRRWSPDYDSKSRHLAAFVSVCEWLYRASPLKGDLTNKGSIEIRK